MDYDVIVIGAGVNGSSAAYHAAKGGCKTALIEQFPVPHSRGSSAGHSRITRLANYGIPELTPFMVDSMRQWKHIEQEAAKTLYRPGPLICVTDSSKPEQERKITNSLELAGINPSLTHTASFNRTNGTSYPNGRTFVEDSSAGILMADKCLSALQNLFMKYGGKIYESFDVHDVKVSPGGTVSVFSSKGHHLTSKKLIVCAGPWTNRILGFFGVVLPLRPIKVAVYYWKIREPSEFTKYTLIDTSEDDLHVYGLPSVEYPGLLKVCYHSGPDIDPDHRDIHSMDQVKQKMCRYVSERLPFLEITPSVEEYCIYTLSPDDEMIVDKIPFQENIVYACGFSGSGFKTGPSVGQVLSELVQGSKTSIDIHAFRASRFPNSSLKMSKI